jgi:hypothetical protein
MEESVLLQPKKTFDEFQKWLQLAPIRQRMTIENVTMRDKGVLDKRQLILAGSAQTRISVKDMYEAWYLLRWVGNGTYH